MDLEEVKSLIEMLEGTDIVEIDVEEDDKKVKIKKGYTPGEVNIQSQVPGNNVTEREEQKSDENENDDEEVIVAPMVGTFYRSPAPDAEPFVEVGDIINSGDTLCIIEAMKLMNEIEAETKGKILEILVEDSRPVEYGQPLFRIELL